MSLINDALKRAGTNPKPAASLASASEPAMVAVTAAALASKPHQGTPVAMIAGMIALTAVAGWFFLKWREVSSGQQAVQISASAKPAPAANVQAPPPAATKPALPAVVAVTRPEPAPQAGPIAKVPSPVIASPASAVSSQPTAAPAAAAQAKPQPEPMPDLKLQAIVFRMKNPSALINGHHVEVGDDVSGARVTEIQRTTVIVEWQGKRQPLQIR